VVLSTDGKIVGFQPTSGVGVNHWAANPLAKELYGGRNLSPGKNSLSLSSFFFFSFLFGGCYLLLTSWNFMSRIY
jgi:hypothetical protein